MSSPIPVTAMQDALVLLQLDELTVSEVQVRAKRTAAARATHPDLFQADLDKEMATDRLSRINEACDMLLECLEIGILPRFRYPKKLDDFSWQPAGTDGADGQRPRKGQPKSQRRSKKPPAWVRDEYKLFTEWCATIEYLTVERMDREWKRRLEAARFDEEMRVRREAEAAERLRQEVLAEAAVAEEEKRREDAELARHQKRLQKQAEAAERKRARLGVS